MMTVRFPNGFSIQYNDASYAERHAEGYTDLYTAKDPTTRRWVAQVPNAGCVIEVVSPCRVYNANEQPTEVARAFASAIEAPNRGKLDGSYLKRIKKALESFDSRTYRWK
jgi:hypothetical protein